MPTLFTRIIQGDLPASFVYQDDLCVAFLSIHPIRPGHTLVVPRDEVDHWVELDPRLAGHLVQVAQKIGAAQMEAFQPRRIGLMIAGLEVPHVHLHVIPIDREQDLHFANANLNPDPADLDRAAEALRSRLE